MAPELRLLIADDEALARKLLRGYLAETANVDIVCECVDTAAVGQALERMSVDAAVLDIRMPGPDLFGVLRQAGAHRPLPPLVFATAFDRYAVQAFEMNAVDYLVKPFSRPRFETALTRLRERSGRNERGEGLWRALRDLGPRPDRLLVPHKDGMVPLPVASIRWIKAEDDYARIYAGDRDYLVYRTLNDLEARLDPTEFLRIHRSAMVRVDQIVKVQSADSSRYRVTLADGTALLVSRSRANALRRFIL